MPVIDATTDLGTRALKHLRGDKVGWLTTVGAKSATPAPNPVWVLAGTAHVDDDGVSGSDFAEFSAKYEADMRAIGFATPDQFYADYSVPVRFVPDRLRGF